MNRLERSIYNVLKENPALKNFIVDLYQRACYLIPSESIVPEELIIREGFFFGFHDKCPWSANNMYVLAHRYNDLPLIMPGPDDTVDIGYFSDETLQNYICLGKSRAWNWQMGAMLQWVGNSNHIVFNDYNGHKNIARIIDIEGGPVKTLEQPIAAVSSDGRKALSFTFERQKKGAFEYAYANGSQNEENQAVPENDGLILIDLKTGAWDQIIRIKDLYLNYHEDSMDGAYHFLSHCLFSPGNDRFIFYHRWRRSNGLLKTRMISCMIDGKRIHIFPTSGMVSHACWKNRDSVLAYASTESDGDRYYLFQDQTNEYSVVGSTVFDADGHPQYSHDSKTILTDTYPDRLRRQSLLIFQPEKNTLDLVARLRIPLKYRYGVRCDFHPRWNRDSTRICFDSAHSGKRALCILKPPYTGNR
ncbi:hypothetical protein JW948_07140 [bacterium]|nr:hypothetical protein [bacterium]